MSDSSTQHGREFEHTMCTILAKSDLSDTYHEGTQLIGLRNSGQPFDDALANQERQIMATLKSRIMHWHLPLLKSRAYAWNIGRQVLRICACVLPCFWYLA